jgi:hypothetical protein
MQPHEATRRGFPTVSVSLNATNKSRDRQPPEQIRYARPAGLQVNGLSELLNDLSRRYTVSQFKEQLMLTLVEDNRDAFVDTDP